MISINTPLASIPYINQRKYSAYKKLGLLKASDLLIHRPRGFIDRTKSGHISSAKEGVVYTYCVFVNGIHKANKPKIVNCSNETGFIDLVYFKEPSKYIKSFLQTGQRIVISGKVTTSSYDRRPQMLHPDIVDNQDKYHSITRIEPIYALSAGITSRTIMYDVLRLISIISDWPEEWLRKELLQTRGWPTWRAAIECIHKTPHLEHSNKAKERLLFDKLLAQQLMLMHAKAHTSKTRIHIQHFSGELAQRFIKSLPFELTHDQQNAIKEISYDQRSDVVMSRLLQGDVGSGKTVVAICAALNAIEGGMQAAIAAPTAILAKQYYSNFHDTLENLGIETVLLLGGNTSTTKIRAANLKLVSSDKPMLVIGTHSLFQQNISFGRLGIAIIDEQHKFGVMQRTSIMTKGNGVDLLMMSATPIPRTLKIALYGDMSLSTIRHKPHNRVPVKTSIMPISSLNKLLERVDAFIKENGKAYWICPMVEQSEKVEDIQNVMHRFDELAKLFPNTVGVIHGKLQEDAKDRAMQQFASGSIRILVATTVIEVGIDVRDANLIIIENAERFGLAQLHQLRGRVGRGGGQGYCILLYNQPISHVSIKRLDIMRSTDDGFAIAEQDLKLRGSGDIIGTRQSGIPEILDEDGLIYYALLEAANEEAKTIGHMEIIKNHPLRQLIRLYYGDIADDVTLAFV